MTDRETLTAIFSNVDCLEVETDKEDDSVLFVRHKYGQGDIALTFSADGTLFDTQTGEDL